MQCTSLQRLISLVDAVVLSMAAWQAQTRCLLAGIEWLGSGLHDGHALCTLITCSYWACCHRVHL